MYVATKIVAAKLLIYQDEEERGRNLYKAAYFKCRSFLSMYHRSFLAPVSEGDIKYQESL